MTDKKQLTPRETLVTLLTGAFLLAAAAAITLSWSYTGMSTGEKVAASLAILAGLLTVLAFLLVQAVSGKR